MSSLNCFAVLCLVITLTLAPASAVLAQMGGLSEWGGIENIEEAVKPIAEAIDNKVDVKPERSSVPSFGAGVLIVVGLIAVGAGIGIAFRK